MLVVTPSCVTKVIDIYAVQKLESCLYCCMVSKTGQNGYGTKGKRRIFFSFHVQWLPS